MGSLECLPHLLSATLELGVVHLDAAATPEHCLGCEKWAREQRHAAWLVHWGAPAEISVDMEFDGELRSWAAV